MRIKTLNLKSFGKFENFKIDFKDGLNIIYGVNGSGKSTISSALKSFLYRDLKGEGRYKKNYVPLGEKQGAYDVLFKTDNDEEYETYITAGLTQAKTVHKTIRISDNKEIATGKETGEYFLNTREDMYDSVCFIKDPSDYPKVSKNDKIVNEKLSASSNKERATVDINAAIESLIKEKLSYQRQTSSGMIYPLEEELYEINKSISEIDALSYEDKAQKEAEEEITSLINSKKERKNILDKKAEQFIKYEEYEKYLLNKKANDRKSEIKDELSKLNTEEVNLSTEEISKIKEADEFKIGLSPWRKLLLGVAGVFGIAGIFLPWMYFLCLGFLCGTVVEFFIHKNKFNKKREQLTLEKIKILENAGLSSLDEYYNKRNEYKSYIEKKELLLKELESISSFVKEDIKEVEYQEKPNGDYSQIKTELLMLLEEIPTLCVKLSEIKERRKNLYNNLPLYEELKDKKEELELKINSLKYEEKVVLATLDSLEKTREKYKVSYLPSLSKRAEEILKNAEKGIYDKLVLDESFSPSLREENSNLLKEKDYISSGVSDGVYLAIRLAVCEFAFKDREKPVLILDDPFVRMDDERAALWIKYLMNETDFQIVLFTAGKRIFNLGLENDTIFAL